MCPIVRIRQGPVTRKGRVNRRQEAVLSRKSHCPQRGPCDGTAARERDRPFGTAARERDRPFGTAARERDRPFGTAARERDRPFGIRDLTVESTGLRTAGRLRGCPIVCLIRVDGTPRKELGTFSGEPSGTANGNEGPRLGGAVPSGVRCPVASPAGLHDRTRLLGGGMSMGIAGMSRCPCRHDRTRTWDIGADARAILSAGCVPCRWDSGRIRHARL